MESKTTRSGLLGGSGQIRLNKGLPRTDLASRYFLDPELNAEEARELESFLDFEHVEVEIGCGRGHFIEDMARNHPERRFVVLEARTKYCKLAVRRLEHGALTNVRVVQGDARHTMPLLIKESSLRAIYLMFPDPWWKKRHHKKRVATTDFFEMLGRHLAPDGVLAFRSDVREYVALVDKTIAPVGSLVLQENFPSGVSKTHRQKKCIEKDLPFWERSYRKGEGAND